MNLIDELRKTEQANAKLKSFYYENRLLGLKLLDFLKLDFRYQIGVFLHFLAVNNLKITTYRDAYTITLLDKTKIKREDVPAMGWMFDKLKSGDLLVHTAQIEIPDYVVTKAGLELEVLRQAIVKAMQYVNA